MTGEPGHRNCNAAGLPLMLGNSLQTEALFWQTLPNVLFRVPAAGLAMASQGTVYEAQESPPPFLTFRYGFQFSLMATVTLLVTPVVVARASGLGDAYLSWMMFASLLVVGASTLIQVRRLGPVGAGAMLPMFTAAFSIPFCITAVVDGGPATLMALVFVSALAQLAISRWLVILRRIITPTVGGTVVMILSITLASVVFALLDEAAQVEPKKGPATALITLVIVAALILRGSPMLRLWGPVIGIVAGCITALALGIYDFEPVARAPWVGLPHQWPDYSLNLGITFWTLLPSFLFLGVIISIQSNGESIAHQRVARRRTLAVDFRQVQGAMAGTGVSNLLASILGAVPNVINSGAVSFTQTTGMASRRVGYLIGVVFVLVAFSPKISSALGTIPAPVVTGYLLLVTGNLLVDGARTIIQSESNRQKIVVAGVCFWLGAAFQFGLFALPDLGGVVNALLKSGITTGGLAAVVMILYLELTNPRQMRFQSKLNIDALPDLTDFVHRFADRRGWDDAMKERLGAVAEETLLTLAPLDLEGLLSIDDIPAGPAGPAGDDDRHLIVLASSDGQMADLEFIGGRSGANVEDQVHQLQQHDTLPPTEQDLSLRLLRSYATSVKHQQYHDTDIITVRVGPPSPN